MKIYPATKYYPIHLKNPGNFMKELSSITEIKNRSTNVNNTKLVGKIYSEGFIVEIKSLHRNSFRPIIKGIIDSNKLQLSIELNNVAVYVLMLGYAMCLLAIISSGSFVFIFAAICWTILWYFMGWALYSIDIKKTKKAIHLIVSCNKP